MEVPSIYLNRILSEGVKRRAFSLHLTVGNFPIIKVGGEFFKLENENLVTADLLNKIVDFFFSEAEKIRFKQKKEIILVKELGNLRFRINVFFQKGIPSFSFYFISKNIRTLQELNLPKILGNLIKTNFGLFIIAGHYGSGRTTTAAALIEEINRTEGKRIITLEKPIENLFVSKSSIIEQREIGKDVNSVVDGLKYCLEEDVDVVYVSEIRNNFKEAISLILEIASGNALVILEMNANNTTAVVEKFLSMTQEKILSEINRYALADVLIAVLAQRLFYGRGGGVVIAPELLIANQPVRSLIREGKIYQLESIIQTSRREGMISMKKSIEDLVSMGEIRAEET